MADISAHVIAQQNMYAMCDTEGNQYYLLLSRIVGHRNGESGLARNDMNIKHGSY